LADKLLQGADDAPFDGFGDVLHTAAVAAKQEPLDEAVGMVLCFVPAEQRSVPIQEKIEFGFESAKFMHVHARLQWKGPSPRIRTRLVPNSPLP